VSELIAPGDPSHVVAVLDTYCRDIRTANPDHRLSVWAVWCRLRLVRPDLVPGIVLAIAAGEDGPLDDNLDQLLNAWVEHDEPALIDWLASMETQRLAVRLAVGTAFVNYGWTDRGGPFIDLYRRGTQDPAPRVRERFLMGSSRLLVADPAGTAADLLAGSISSFAAIHVLEQACHYDGSSWGPQLDERDAGAVLDLVRHAGWDDYSVQQIVSGIARVHPRLVLDHLVAAHRTGKLPTDVHGLAAAFDDQAEALIDWMVAQGQRGDVGEASAVVGRVVDAGLTAAQSDRLDAAMDGLDGSGLLTLVSLLGNLHTWPLRHPRLARRFLTKARESSADTADALRAELAAAMHVGMWTSTDGVSPELSSALTAAAAAAEVETDSELRDELERARGRLEDLVAQELRENEEDDEAE